MAEIKESGTLPEKDAPLVAFDIVSKDAEKRLLFQFLRRVKGRDGNPYRGHTPFVVVGVWGDLERSEAHISREVARALGQWLIKEADAPEPEVQSLDTGWGKSERTD